MEDQYNIEERKPFRREIYPGENRVHYQIQRLTRPQEAFVKSLTQKGAPIEKVKPMLKRRVGYMQEEVSMTRAKLEGMKISEHIETNNDKGKESDEEMDRRDETTPAQ
jgi:hypothetical protein